LARTFWSNHSWADRLEHARRIHGDRLADMLNDLGAPGGATDGTRGMTDDGSSDTTSSHADSAWTHAAGSAFMSDAPVAGAGMNGAGSSASSMHALEKAPSSVSNGNMPSSITVADGGTAEISGTTAQPVSFTGTTGTLMIDHSLAYTGQISGLAGSDALDLADLSYGPNTTATFSGNANGGTLTVADGGKAAHIALTGDYLNSGWTLSSDGHGGTLVVDPPLNGARPDATNTGVPAGTPLKASGGLVITTPGQVINGLDITGGVDIHASNVTLENCIIRVSDANANWVVSVLGGLTGITIKNCEIIGPGSVATTQTAGIYIIGDSQVTIDSTNIHEVGHGIDVSGGPVTIQNSYIHDLNANASSHYDGIYYGGGSSSNFALNIQNNTIINSHDQTSAIFTENYFGGINNVTVNNNLLVGGGYTVYLVSNTQSNGGGGAGGPVSNVSYTNNHLGSGYWGTTAFEGPYNPVYTGNVNDGATLAAALPVSPVITSAAAAAGTYGVGNTITLTLYTSEAVNVSGTPTLTLNDGGTATYTGSPVSNALTFKYTVGSGQNTSALAVTSINGTIKDYDGHTLSASNLSASFAGVVVGSGSGSGTSSPPATVAPPVISTFSTDTGVAGDHITSDNTPTLTGTAVAGSTVNLFDGTKQVGTAVADSTGKWTVTTSALSDGAHNLTATDTVSGQTSAASAAYAVTIDTHAPAAPVLVSDSIVNTNQVLLSGTAEANSTITVYNGTAVVGTAITNSTGAWSVTTSALSSGMQALTATATDVAGTVSAMSQPLDPVIPGATQAPAAPKITSFSPDTGVVGDHITSDNTPTLIGTAVAGSTVNVFDGAKQVGTATADSTGKWTVTTSTLSDGAHNLTATDTVSGQTSAASAALAVTIDTHAPAAPILVSDSIVNTNHVLLSGTAEANSAITVYDGTTVVGTGTTNSTGAWSLTTSALSSGSQALTATATDAAGMVSAMSQALDPVIPTGTGTGAGLPAGVTLKPIDGGANYYASNGFTNAANAGWDNPDFIPIGPWMATMTTQSQANTWLQLGWNTAFRTDGGMNLSLLDSNKIWAIQQWDDYDASGTGAETVGLLTYDGATNYADAVSTPLSSTPNSVQDGRFWYVNNIWNFLEWNTTGTPGSGTATEFLNDPVTTPNGTQAHINTSSVDEYWFAGGKSGYDNTLYAGKLLDNLSANMTPDQAARGSNYGDIITDEEANTGGTTPLYAIVETGGPYTTNTSASSYITPPELNWAVWSSLIHGARGVIYFDHTFGGPAQSNNNMYSSYYQTVQPGQTVSMSTQVQQTDALVDQLAPVLNSSTALGYVSVNTPGYQDGVVMSRFSGIETMAKDYNGQFYIFADTRDSETQTNISATFTIADKNATSVTVVNENRTIAVTNGVFTDTFANGAAVHIYEVNDGPSGTPTPPTPPAAPVIASFSPDSGVVGDGITNATTLDIHGTAVAGSTVTVYDNGTQVGTAKADSTTGSWDYITAVLTNAKHVLTATDTTSSGTSAASAALTVTVDTVAPNAPVISSSTSAGSSAYLLKGTAEAGSTVDVFDGTNQVGTVKADATSGAWSVTVSSLAVGTHSLTAKAVDAAGNTSTASTAVSAVVSGPTPPAAPTITSFSTDSGTLGDHITNDNTPTLSGTAVANSTVTVFEGTTQLGTATADSSGHWTTLPTSALSDGTHNLTATDTDSSGHTSAPSANFSITVDTHAPAAPTLAAYSQGGSAIGSATTLNDLVLKGTAEANSAIHVFDGGNQIGTATTNGSGAWSYDTGNLVNGSHNFTATAVDAAGNASGASAVLTETVTAPTSPAPTAHAPIEFTNVSLTWSNHSFTIKGTADAYSQIKLYDGTVSLGTVKTSSDGSWSFTTKSLTDTLHTVTAQELDNSGHVVETSSGAVLLPGSHTSTLTGTGGDDFLFSSSSQMNDTFVFASTFGHSTIEGFTVAGPGQDTIQFSKSVFDNFASVLSHASQVGQDVVISSGSDTLTMKNTKIGTLTSHDFHFV